jgi:hypothetical protein
MKKTSRYPYFFLKRAFRLIVPATIYKLESLLIKKNIKLKFAPIFIIGVPRSGTTLAYQVMTTVLKLCYFNNLMKYLPGCPNILSLLTSPAGGNKAPMNFSSFYGATLGWNAPYQGEAIWWRWFPRDPHYVGSGFLNSRQQKELRNTISLIEYISRVPFVNKWPANSVHIIPLAETFPEAVFIRVNRDPVMVAQSILHGRKEYKGDVKKWLSAKPSNFKKIESKTNIDQVCEQIYYIEQDMDRDSKVVGKNKFLNIEYEELCKSPKNVINKIRGFYSSAPYGCALSDRGNLPERFFRRSGMKVSIDAYKSIEACLNKLYH